MLTSEHRTAVSLPKTEAQRKNPPSRYVRHAEAQLNLPVVTVMFMVEIEIG